CGPSLASTSSNARASCPFTAPGSTLQPANSGSWIRRPGISCAPIPNLRRLTLWRDQPAGDQQFRDLHRIERGALAQIVGDHPEIDTFHHRRILTDPADIGRILARHLVGRDVAAILMLVDDETTRSIAKDLPRLLGA